MRPRMKSRKCAWAWIGLGSWIRASSWACVVVLLSLVTPIVFGKNDGGVAEDSAFDQAISKLPQETRESSGLRKSQPFYVCRMKADSHQQQASYRMTDNTDFQKCRDLGGSSAAGTEKDRALNPISVAPMPVVTNVGPTDSK